VPSTIEVKRTYLEMKSLDELKAAPVPEPEPLLERVPQCTPELFRYLYAEVGRAFRWTDRLSWSEEQIVRHLANPRTSVWILSWHKEPAGYFELQEHEDRSVEIAYFGLLPNFIGRGWGKHLLTRAVRAAWSLGASRVWLHTCTLDHPAALPNYLKRGFRPVREEVYEVSGEAGKPGSGEV
jgi:GNAT superfamily N-acetyltransferase